MLKSIFHFATVIRFDDQISNVFEWIMSLCVLNYEVVNLQKVSKTD